MKLYKYKSLSGTGLLHVLDMIVNNRIYLPTCSEMNDPMEGRLNVPDEDHGSATWGDDPFSPSMDDRQSISKLIHKTRFCAFCVSPVKPLLWAHYAGGFSGVALEYEFTPEALDGSLIKEIDYNPTKFHIDQERIDKMKAGDAVYNHGHLTNKNGFWHDEQEYRLFHKDPESRYFAIKPIGLIAGVRNPDNFHNHPLNTIARKFDVPVDYLVPKSLYGNEFLVQKPNGDSYRFIGDKLEPYDG